MRRKKFVRAGAILLAILMPMITGISALADDDEPKDAPPAVGSYESPDINELTGAGKEPEELSVSSGAVYQEKAWYEYVTYSDHAVSSYRVNDISRMLFYDPYTYTNSMIMDVEFDTNATEFDTMSSYSVSHTTKKTIEACVSSTDTSTDAVQSSGRDIYHEEVENSGTKTTTYNHSITDQTTGTVKQYTDYQYKLLKTNSSSTETTLSDTTGLSTSAGANGPVPTAEVTVSGSVEMGRTDTYASDEAWHTDRETQTTEYSPGYKTSTDYTGTDTVEDNTESKTDGWTELSARVTKTIGSSIASSRGWSEEESTTVTKTYAATHFASDGVTPLPWAIVHYQVQMPMKCCLQIKSSGEWSTISTVYCLLTTVQGTCRAWMENGQTYYEDWGNGEPVVAADFWSHFLTKKRLIELYSNKLYPVGGAD